MTEKPIERLNYYNGQRLEASDLKLEQEYHIRVRRWLNKSLYSPGIARGLGVKPEEGTLNVIISPGLALDFEGREIILLEEERIPVIGKHNIVGTEDVGSYLTIQYREQTTAEEENGCVPRNKASNKTGNRLAWKGPTRVLAKPIIGWSDRLPHESSGKIILARVILNKGCTEIKSVESGERHYVGAASAAKVRQYALEGERHIDKNNPGRIYFHIRGGQPSITLYLRAEKFPTLYYTEMGQHNHILNVKGNSETSDAEPSVIPVHDHGPGTLQAQGGPPANHGHTIQAFYSIGNLENGKGGIVISSGGVPWSFNFQKDNGNPKKSFLQDAGTIIGPDGGDHSHTIIGSTEGKSVPYSHKHKFTPSVSIEPAGVTYSARSGSKEKALNYVEDLQVYIDGTDEMHNQTRNILRQLKNVQSTIDWEVVKLGNGAENHPLVQKGTGEIILDFLGFTEGEHFIELKVSEFKANRERNGGRILYNLYVE